MGERAKSVPQLLFDQGRRRLVSAPRERELVVRDVDRDVAALREAAEH